MSEVSARTEPVHIEPVDSRSDDIEVVPEPMVFRVSDLNVHYGDFRAVRDVSIEIRQREITAFIGPSGCGKTTVLRCFNRMNDLVETARHHVEDVSCWRVAQPVGMKRRRLPEAALHDHAVPFAGAGMANRAVNVVAFSPALQELAVDLHRHFGQELLFVAAGMERRIELQLPAGDGAFHLRASRLAVGEKLARFEPLVARLIAHVAMAAGQQAQNACGGEARIGRKANHRGTS